MIILYTIWIYLDFATGNALKHVGQAKEHWIFGGPLENKFVAGASNSCQGDGRIHLKSSWNVVVLHAQIWAQVRSQEISEECV